VKALFERLEGFAYKKKVEDSVRKYEEKKSFVEKAKELVSFFFIYPYIVVFQW